MFDPSPNFRKFPSVGVELFTTANALLSLYLRHEDIDCQNQVEFIIVYVI